jgi:hypothetical protein
MRDIVDIAADPGTRALPVVHARIRRHQNVIGFSDLRLKRGL